jgi:hypothetical protein
MKYLPGILAAFFLLASCKEKGKAELERKDGFTKVLKTKEDSLVNEVMEGHDIGMARMQKISKYLEQIKVKLDSLSKVPATKLDENYQQSLIDLQEDLNYAEYGMNTWMDEFRLDTLKDNKEKRLEYLEAEKKKILEVKESILSSLARADSLFKK